MGSFDLPKQQDSGESGCETVKSRPLNSIDRENSLLNLPSEIIHQILLYLPCQSLVSVSRSCQKLRHLAQEDLLWSDLLSQHVPANDFPPDSYPSSSYRDLYITHHPYWFLPEHKVWISDEPHIGRIMLCRFDPRRGCIEGYRLLAERGPSTRMLWPYRPSVVIHSFVPRCHLWLDDPILKLPHEATPFNARQGWWEGEIKMSVGRPGHNTLASFFLSRSIPEHLQDKSMELWPPRTIPKMPRVRAASADKFRGKGHKPQKYEEISDTTFRLRHWSQFRTGVSHFGVRIGEEVSTWSTIDPILYTPTAEKPYQGIYVGDYAGHGCEFLLVMQTDRAGPLPTRQRNGQSAGLLGMVGDNRGMQSEYRSDTNGAWPVDSDRAPLDDALWQDEEENHFHGAIEAVKLTGDPNIPRGEHTFIADDIGPRGFIRIAHEQPFPGARVVRSRGHVADRGFQNDRFIPSELIMVSHDKLAQYWIPIEYWLPSGHISYYSRIDIDQIMASTFGPADIV